MIKVALCICTCRRPEGLNRLLRAIAELDFDGNLSVVVVENDARREGLAVCHSIAENYRWPLTCVIEELQGISFARNRAVSVALDQQPDFIAMLDDDEWPEPRWLRELLRIQASENADAVGGPVLPAFPPNSLPWSNLADYYGSDQKLSDAEKCVLYATGNFLARAACFRSLMPAPFDPAFAISGGEDLVFFSRLAVRGYKMNWSAHGIVHEEVATSRMSLTWLRHRQVRRGNLNVIVQRMFEPGTAREMLRLSKTGGLLIIALLYYLVAIPHQPSRIRASLLLHKGFGKILGHLGRNYKTQGRVKAETKTILNRC